LTIKEKIHIQETYNKVIKVDSQSAKSAILQQISEPRPIRRKKILYLKTKQCEIIGINYG
jgi:hypothetical protein